MCNIHKWRRRRIEKNSAHNFYVSLARAAQVKRTAAKAKGTEKWLMLAWATHRHTLTDGLSTWRAFRNTANLSQTWAVIVSCLHRSCAGKVWSGEQTFCWAGNCERASERTALLVAHASNEWYEGTFNSPNYSRPTLYHVMPHRTYFGHSRLPFLLHTQRTSTAFPTLLFCR